ncbi:MAG: hypothetical protein QF673_01705 [Candidatus Hydrothermarchaeota archaeon]|nr:hypothetical protein [Candidatus Hydrothermarchaeota archaeon]MDP6612716.1 hypothetical protein [Candidatus Hydrothermarchaeota archaeon]
MGVLSKIILIFLVLAGIGGVYAYTSLVKPLSKLQVQPGEIEPVSLEPMVLQISLEVVNPDKPLKLPGATLNLYLEDELVGTGSLPNTVIQVGPSRLVSKIHLDKDLIELASIAGEETSLSIDGTLLFKVLSFDVKIPIPRVPVPGGLDFIALAGGEASQSMEILRLLKKTPNLKMGDALVSEAFLEKLKEKTGNELTDTKIQELKQLLGTAALNKTVDELLKDPSILQKLQ